MPELVKCLRQVFERSRQYNLKLNKSKCEFGVSKTSIFEHIVSAYGIQPDPTKTEAIKRTPPPENVSDLLSGHVVAEITFVLLRRKKWADFVKQKRPKWEPTRNSSICSKHFTENDYIRRFTYVDEVTNKPTVPRLKRDELGVTAVPSIHAKNPSNWISCKDCHTKIA